MRNTVPNATLWCALWCALCVAHTERSPSAERWYARPAVELITTSWRTLTVELVPCLSVQRPPPSSIGGPHDGGRAELDNGCLPFLHSKLELQPGGRWAFCGDCFLPSSHTSRRVASRRVASCRVVSHRHASTCFESRVTACMHVTNGIRANTTNGTEVGRWCIVRPSLVNEQPCSMCV